MSITPQTNTTLPEIAATLLKHENFVICGHVNPDGDCLGSQLALAQGLKLLGKQVTCLLARNEPIGSDLQFLPHLDEYLVPASTYEGPLDVFIAVDVPSTERIGEAAPLQARAKLTVTIDHHAVPKAMAQLSYTDPDVASTTILIWRLLKLLCCPITADMASCTYAGLMTDTGRFQYQNADVACFQAAIEMMEAGAKPAVLARNFYQNRSLASICLERRTIERLRFVCNGECVLSWIGPEDFEEYGATKADAEPLVDLLRSIAGVRIACMLRDRGDEVRGSIRAKDDTDVSVFARKLGGGGHHAAAGFQLAAPMAEAVDIIAAAMEKEFGVQGSGESLRDA